MKNKFFRSFICSLILITMISCGTKANNEIYNKVYNVDIDLNQIDEAFIPAVERASESTLGITSYSRKSLLQAWQIVSVGSCVIYETKCVLNDGTNISYEESFERDDIAYYEYKAITNAHVLAKENSFMKYTIYDGETNNTFELEILSKDNELDLAVVEFQSPTLYIPIVFSDNVEVKKGQIVLAIGNANGYEYYSSATMGIISYPNRLVEESSLAIEYIQHDAAINPGNSGGALVDINGNLIGINTSKIVDDDIDGMGFAIPINTVLSVIERLENGKEIKKLSTGLTGKSINDVRLDAILNENEYNIIDYKKLEYGYIVEEVSDQSIFKKYLLKNDVILEVDSKIIYSELILKNKIMLLEKGDSFSIKILRQNIIKDITITL